MSETDTSTKTIFITAFVVLGSGMLAAITLSVLAYTDKKKTTTTVTQNQPVAAGSANRDLLTQGKNMSINYVNDSYLIGLTPDINVTSVAASSISTNQLNIPKIPAGSMLCADASGNLVNFAGNTENALKFLAQSENGTPTWESPGASTGRPMTVNSFDENLSVTLGGTPGTALLTDTSISVNWQGQLSAVRGGAGLSGYAVGDMLYADSQTTLRALNSNASPTRKYLSSVADAPSWSEIDANDISGAVPVSKGGTGEISFTDGQIMIGSSTGSTLLKSTLSGTENQVIVTNGSGSITLS